MQNHLQPTLLRMGCILVRLEFACFLVNINVNKETIKCYNDYIYKETKKYFTRGNSVINTKSTEQPVISFICKEEKV